jgi:uncharacterized protein (TIRG00374 family)
VLSKGKITLVAKLLTSAGLIYLIGVNVDLGQAMNTAAQLGFVPTSIAASLALLQIPCLGFRWRSILKLLDLSSTTGEILRLTFIGFFFNQVLPTSFGGDAVKAWYLHRQGALLKFAILSVIFDRVAALCLIIGTVIILLPALSGLLDDRVVFWSLAIAIALIGLAIVSALFAHEFIARSLRRVKALAAFADFVQIFGRTFSSRSILHPIIWALAGLFLSITIVFLLALGMDIPLSFWECLVIVPIVILGASLPISFAGWGVREGSMVFMLGFIGISAADALALSVMMGLIIMSVSTIGGLIWLLTRNSPTNLVNSGAKCNI